MAQKGRTEKNLREGKYCRNETEDGCVIKKSWESVGSENTEKDTLQPQRRERKGKKEVNALFYPGETKRRRKGENSNDEESFAAYPPFFLENPTCYKKATKEKEGREICFIPKCQTRAVPF